MLKSYGSKKAAKTPAILARKRERARKALELIGRVFLFTDDFSTAGSLVFTGSPGTGKSFCLAFIALVCHHAGIPFKLIGNPKGRVFSGHANSAHMPGDSTDECEIMHLIDHFTVGYQDPTHRVVFTSPDNKRLSLLDKDPGAQSVLYMGTWSLDEVRACASSCLGLSDDVITARINPLYEKFGGIVRFVLRECPEDEDFDGWIDRQVRKNINTRISSINGLEHLRNALIITEQIGAPKSYVVVHIRIPGEKHIGDITEIEEVCGSRYIRDKLVDKMEETLDQEAMEMFFFVSGGEGKASSLLGQLFQPIVRKALCQRWTETAEKSAICYLGPLTHAPRKRFEADTEGDEAGSVS